MDNNSKNTDNNDNAGGASDNNKPNKFPNLLITPHTNTFVIDGSDPNKEFDDEFHNNDWSGIVNELNCGDNNAFLTLLSVLTDPSKLNNIKQDDVIYMKFDNESNNTPNNNSISINLSDYNKPADLQINSLNSKIDIASATGDINTLSTWLTSKTDTNGKYIITNQTDNTLENINNYTSNSLDHASANGKINVLDWWLKANKETNLPLKYTIKAIDIASKNGKIDCLDWWLNSGLELKYSANAIDYATNDYKIESLDWWIKNYRLKKVRFDYGSNSMDNCKLVHEKMLTMVTWWKDLKISDGIDIKYSTEFTRHLEIWKLNSVLELLTLNNMIKPIDPLNNSHEKKSTKSTFYLNDLLGNLGAGLSQKSSYSNKIDITSFPEAIQTHIKEKEEELNNNTMVNGKTKEYIDNLIKIPFGKYRTENIFKFTADFIIQLNIFNSKSSNKLVSTFKIINESDLTNFLEKVKYSIDGLYTKYCELYTRFCEIRVEYLSYVDNILNSTIYGHDSTKKQIKCILSQWLSGGMNTGIVIGVQGPPGVGKTTFIKGALAKCLVNFITYDLSADVPFIKLNETNTDFRPFCFTSLGGTTNGSTLMGHGITYHGATSGDIVKNLKEAKVMNPILYFDELDKISNTEHGHEISSALTHITDPVQNEHFIDRYFAEVKIDLSKAIIVFSYNDSSKVDRILLDRIQEMRIDAIKHKEKLVICNKFLIPEICKSIGYNSSDINISNESLDAIILEYTYEAGVRKLKEKLQEIIRMNHLNKMSTNTMNGINNIDLNYVHDTFGDYSKVYFKKINTTPVVGNINGMYASTIGVGGITVIQVKPTYHKEILHINITGSVEQVMNESIQVAKTVAYNLLNIEQQNVLHDSFKDKGLHIHCPDGATPKDGPSAGTAITLAIYSALTNKLIRNDIAITGEIELNGNVTMIGGLDAKLNGAKKAGVKLALIPSENLRDFEIIKKKNPELIDESFEVKLISHVNDAMDIIFV